MTLTIKKYPNRKLYNTETCKYINVSELYYYVKNGLTIKVVEHKTEKDITAETLLSALKQIKFTNLKLNEIIAIIQIN